MSATRLILASGSPRRREMLGWVGLPFTVARPDIDETPHAGEPADQYVVRLSQEKSAAIRSAAGAGSVVITADTTVADGPLILGKPTNADEAYAMLAQLRGRPHAVHTGVTVHNATTGTVTTSVTTTHIMMRSYGDHEIQAYIDAGEPFDKAGGYAIQDKTFRPVERYDGCYANVMGLPLCMLCAMLRDVGIEPPTPPSCSPQQTQDGGQCAFAR